MDSLSPPDGLAVPADILITEELERRAHRPPDFEGEARLLLAVAREQIQRPEAVLDTLLRGAMALCGAGSAGISVIQPDTAGVFSWTNLVGVYGPHVGGSTPVEWSPCGVTIDRGTAQLFRRPAGFFTYFAAVAPGIEEGLVVPFAIHGRLIATMWIVSHRADHGFDAEHARVVSRLAAFAGNLIEGRMAKAAGRRVGGDWNGRVATVLDGLDVAKSALAEADGGGGALVRMRERLAAVDTQVRDLAAAGLGLEQDLSAALARRQAAESARSSALASLVEAEGLVAFGHELASETDPARLADAIAAYACRSLDAAVAGFLTLEQIGSGTCLVPRACVIAGRPAACADAEPLRFLPITGTVMVEDLQREAESDPLVRLMRALPIGAGMRSLVATPVHARSGAVLGELVVAHGDPARFTIRDERALASLAEMAAHSFENATRFAQERSLRQAIEEREVLAQLHGDIGRALVAPVPFDRSLHDCCAAIAASLDAAFVRIWVLEASTQTLVLRASAGLYTHLDGRHARIPMGAFKIGRIAQDRTPHLSNRVQVDPQVSDHAWAKREGMVAFAGYPLVMGDYVLGVVGLFARHELSPAVFDMLATASIGIAANIDRNHKETKLAKTADDLLRSNQDLDRFAAIASHDLMEPLRTISNFLSLFERRYGEGFDERGRRYISHATDAAERMTLMVRSLLSYARLAGIHLEVTEVALAQCAQEAVANLSAKIEERQAVVDIGPLPVVHGDAALITQLIQNLISNALKFQTPGTRPRIRIQALEEGGERQLRIEDNGIGIEPSHRERVFAMFQRVHAPGAYEGSGIGLATCRRIMERFRGRIWVDPERVQGTCIVMAFPTVWVD